MAGGLVALGTTKRATSRSDQLHGASDFCARTRCHWPKEGEVPRTDGFLDKDELERNGR